MKTNLRAKKSLGQHFLTSKQVASEMIKASRVTKNDLVLEIGPGKGFLTEHLLSASKKVVAVEKDEKLVSFLEEKFPKSVEEGKLVLLRGDILEMDLEKALVEPVSDYAVISNIPYYITGVLIRKLLGEKKQPKSVTLLLQKEVAKRIVSKDKKESLLSISVKVYGDPVYIQTVSKKLFKPAPKVDSAILSIQNISRDFFRDIDEVFFFSVLRTGFGHKRKMLLNNLAHSFPKTFPKNMAQTVLKSAEIPLKARPENLTKESWKKLCLALLEKGYPQGK